MKREGASQREHVLAQEKSIKAVSIMKKYTFLVIVVLVVIASFSR